MFIAWRMPFWLKYFLTTIAFSLGLIEIATLLQFEIANHHMCANSLFSTMKFLTRNCRATLF